MGKKRHLKVLLLNIVSRPPPRPEALGVFRKPQWGGHSSPNGVRSFALSHVSVMKSTSSFLVVKTSFRINSLLTMDRALNRAILTGASSSGGVDDVRPSYFSGRRRVVFAPRVRGDLAFGGRGDQSTGMSVVDVADADSWRRFWGTGFSFFFIAYIKTLLTSYFLLMITENKKQYG